MHTVGFYLDMPDTAKREIKGVGRYRESLLDLYGGQILSCTSACIMAITRAVASPDTKAMVGDHRLHHTSPSLNRDPGCKDNEVV